MGAVVAATSQTPISAILIIFEITQRIEIIPPLMAACVLSTLVASLVQRESIYTMKLKRAGHRPRSATRCKPAEGAVRAAT